MMDHLLQCGHLYSTTRIQHHNQYKFKFNYPHSISNDPVLVQAAPTSFIGLLARCKSAKAQLDYEWGVRTVYMDDYPLLLDAAATGLRITHAPSTAKDEINTFFTQRMPRCL